MSVSIAELSPAGFAQPDHEQPTHLYEIVMRRALRFPSAVAVGGQDGLAWKTVNSLELLELVDILASELRTEGIGEGDRVVLWVPNAWRTPIYLFALWKLGAVVVAFDREMNPDAAARIIFAVQPRRVLVGYGERPTWLSHAPLLEWWTPGTRRTLDSARSMEWRTPAEELATISFTSGTTGEPKGCMITHANLCSQIQAAHERIPLGPDCRLASILPLSHLFELTAGLLYPIDAGAAIHYISTRRSTDILRVLNEQHITHMMAVPQILTAMQHAIDQELRKQFPAYAYQWLESLVPRLPLELRRRVFWMVHRKLGGHLRLLASGGAPLAAEVHRAWERLGVRVIQGYGASECSPIIACAAADGSTPIGSVGRPLRGVDLRLSREGEVMVHGPNIMRGYWADPHRTSDVLDQDGWYHTGDLANVDRGGNLWLFGRARDLIVLPSGMKVWPEDVESVLRAHPAVSDAAVVAIPTPGGGAKLHAYLLQNPAYSNVELRQIIAECDAHLAQHQRLVSASWWPEADFPRTAMLKVKRHLLPQPSEAGTVAIASTAAADDPVSQAVAGVAHVPTVGQDQTLGELGLDSLGLVELAVALEEKTGAEISDGDLGLDMTVRQVRRLLEWAAVDTSRLTGQTSGLDAIAPDIPLWPYTVGRALRVFGVLVDGIYALGVSRTRIIGGEHLASLPRRVIFAGTHHGFADMPLLRHALARTGARGRGWRLVTATAARGFNSGGPRLGKGMGLFPWYGIVGLGLYPLHQRAQREASLHRLVQIAEAGNDILIFPQGVHARPADERAGLRSVAFHPGVAHLARGLGVDVVPFGVAGTERVIPPDPSAFNGPVIAGLPVAIHRGPLAIAFGPRLALLPGETAEAFALRLQEVCYALTRAAEAVLAARWR